MTNAQLLILLLVPIAFNGFALTLVATLMTNHMNARFQSVEARLELLTGKVVELSDRLARVEERLEQR